MDAADVSKDLPDNLVQLQALGCHLSDISRKVVSPISEEGLGGSPFGGSPTFDRNLTVPTGGSPSFDHLQLPPTLVAQTRTQDVIGLQDDQQEAQPLRNRKGSNEDLRMQLAIASRAKEPGENGSNGPYKPQATYMNNNMMRPVAVAGQAPPQGAVQVQAQMGSVSANKAQVPGGFNPASPAFRPASTASYDQDAIFKKAHNAAFKQPQFGQKAPQHAFQNKGPPGNLQSRLPVFSQLQAMDSGSDRGSSRRSDRSSPTNSIDSLTNSIDSMHTDGTVPPRTLIRELTQKMSSKDESKAAAAAKKVFDIVRESCPTWRQNQTEICRSPEMLIVLASLLRASSERCRYEACRALGNIAFQNPGVLGQALTADVMKASGAADAASTDVCYAIVSCVGMLDGLKYVLRTGTCNSKHEAARVINNCAAYSERAARLIAKSDGIIEGLKALCGQAGRAQRTRAKAVGAINCLSTYAAVRPELLKARVVQDALLPALAQRKKTFGDGDEFKAMRADAVMASANLTGKEEFSVLMVTEPDAFRTVMKCLRYGVEGQVWAGVTWTAYSALLPLSNLTVSDANKATLVELGLIGLLYRVMSECVSRVEVLLAIECLDNLVFAPDCRAEMAKNNATLLKALRVHGVGDDGPPAQMRRCAQRIMWTLSRKNDSPELKILQHNHKMPNGRHIYIVFEHEAGAMTVEEEEELLEKLTAMRDALEDAGFRVLCKPAGGDLDEMAEAVSVCQLFVVCASKRFKESSACRFEVVFAEEANKGVCVALLEGDMDKNYGWLQSFARGKTAVDFSAPCVDGAHPGAQVLVNVASQWLGSPAVRGSKKDPSEQQDPKRSPIFEINRSPGVHTPSDQQMTTTPTHKPLSKGAGGSLSGSNLVGILTPQKDAAPHYTTPPSSSGSVGHLAGPPLSNNSGSTLQPAHAFDGPQGASSFHSPLRGGPSQTDLSQSPQIRPQMPPTKLQNFTQASGGSPNITHSPARMQQQPVGAHPNNPAAGGGPTGPPRQGSISMPQPGQQTSHSPGMRAMPQIQHQHQGFATIPPSMPQQKQPVGSSPPDPTTGPPVGSLNDFTRRQQKELTFPAGYKSLSPADPQAKPLPVGQQHPNGAQPAPTLPVTTHTGAQKELKFPAGFVYASQLPQLPRGTDGQQQQTSPAHQQQQQHQQQQHQQQQQPSPHQQPQQYLPPKQAKAV